MTAMFDPSSVKPPQEHDLANLSGEDSEASVKPPQFEEQAMESGVIADESVKPPQTA